MGFTIGTKLNETAIVKLIDVGTDDVLLDAAGNEMYIEIYSADTKKYRKVLADIVKRNENKRAGKKTNDDILTEVLANCVASWNIETEEGELVFSIESATSVFEANRPVREQCLETQNDRKFFLNK